MIKFLFCVLPFFYNVGHCLRYPVIKTKIEELDYSKAPPNDEQKLLRYILRSYDKSVRPVINASNTVQVEVGITLTHIFNVDEKKQVLSMNIWLEQAWRDERLQWNPSEFGNISQLTVPTRFLWTPDVVLYNNAEDFAHGIIQTEVTWITVRSFIRLDREFKHGTSWCTNVNVYPDGSILWAPPLKSHSVCKLDVSFFPFDEQYCSLRFGSWIYDASQVDVTNRSSKINIDRNFNSYIENGEWQVISTVVERHMNRYPCCDLEYPDVTFSLHLRRRTLYYAYNIIIPCTMLSVLTIMQFCLPAESGEKVTLGLTMLLAYSVFSFNIGEKLPETSDVIPLLAIYIMCVMAISSVSVTFSVMVLNIRHGGECRRGVPNWLRFLAFRVLAPVVCYRTNQYKMGDWFGKQADFQKVFVSLSGRPSTMAANESESESGLENRNRQRGPLSNLDLSPELVRRLRDAKAAVHKNAQEKNYTHQSSIEENHVTARSDAEVGQPSHFDRVLERVNKLTKKLEKDFKSEDAFTEWRKVSHIFDLFFFGLTVFITVSVTLSMLLLAPYFSSVDMVTKRRKTF